MNTQVVDDLFDKGEIEMEDFSETNKSNSKRFEFPEDTETEEKDERKK
jgi:hypothetical protein